MLAEGNQRNWPLVPPPLRAGDSGIFLAEFRELALRYDARTGGTESSQDLAFLTYIQHPFGRDSLPFSINSSGVAGLTPPSYQKISSASLNRHFLLCQEIIGA
jgi:hypothetical protein